MKNIFELIMPVLGLSICILAVQIPAVSWTAHIPFYYFVPHSPHPTNNIAVSPSFASESSAGIIEKFEMTELHRELSQIRMAIAQLTTKSDLHHAIQNAAEKILSNLHMITTKFATKLEMDDMKTKLHQTSSAVEATNIELSATKLDLDNMNTTVGGIDSNLLRLTQAFENETAVVDIGHMPTSCTDLQSIGYKMNGIFQIKGANKIENVYCDFTTNAQNLQKWIGYADVKSAPVHFYVQRNSSFNSIATIPFDLARVNLGNAMNLASGIFTAPRSGRYFFSFTGVVNFPATSSHSWLAVGLFFTNGLIGQGRVDGANTVNNQFSPLTLQSTLNLKQGDQVWVHLDSKTSGMILYDDNYHFTHFTGFMLEEEILASL
ncbi:uncharacterized protein LOC124205886 isoform X2 [Daphnia pulex]|uniref:uncharacterized protein LOC124205886 isoform X2 n=1 Tax=Daphnia pulex TaxID=6669 RepID=UPI001EE04571|nr:uncharacterized protein LOC124205886 isoform X2 [Daphnia pulex]